MPYYRALEARLRDVEGQMVGQRVLDDLRRELRTCHERKGQFGYEMFVLEHRCGRLLCADKIIGTALTIPLTTEKRTWNSR